LRIYTLPEGSQLVKAARGTIELYLKSPHFDKAIMKDGLRMFNQKYGVFVTLEHYPTKSLRGCIGFPNPVSTISNDLVEAALAAAFEDPRFVPVSKPELDNLIVEVSILSEPVEVPGSAIKRKKSIAIGRDGLIVRYGLHSGLLLPIVAVEQKWNAQEFLEQTCVKAGLPKDYWSQPNIQVYKFETQLFREEEPNGKVIEVK
jgi:hypothetical protein